MNGYNSQFAMPDFFTNERLKKVFPQFSATDINIPSDQLLNENVIKNKVMEYLAAALGAKRSNNKLVVNGNYDAVVAKLRALASVCESIFSSAESVVKNIKNKSRIYTTISTIDQLKSLQSVTQKIQVMQEVLENINYNKDFSSLASVNLIEKYKSKNTFERRQILWENKVGYKPDPRLAKMNSNNGWQKQRY